MGGTGRKEKPSCWKLDTVTHFLLRSRKQNFAVWGSQRHTHTRTLTHTHTHLSGILKANRPVYKSSKVFFGGGPLLT